MTEQTDSPVRADVARDTARGNLTVTDLTVTDPYVELVTGTRFYIDRPTFEIRAIAHALAMNCRFNGHVLRFHSVAEHSVLVSRLMEDLDLGNPLEGLLHDAHESVLTDVPSPIKPYLPDWCELDRRLERAVRDQFVLPPEKTLGCAQADLYALFMEAYWLMPNKGADYVDPKGMRDKALELLEVAPGFYEHHGWLPEEGMEQFLRRYEYLTGGETYGG